MPRPYQLLQIVLHIPDVDVHRRKHTIAGNPERDELRISIRASRTPRTPSRYPVKSDTGRSTTGLRRVLAPGRCAKC
jgi:hypothetical protein